MIERSRLKETERARTSKVKDPHKMVDPVNTDCTSPSHNYRKQNSNVTDFDKKDRLYS